MEFYYGQLCILYDSVMTCEAYEGAYTVLLIIVAAWTLKLIKIVQHPSRSLLRETELRREIPT